MFETERSADNTRIDFTKALAAIYAAGMVLALIYESVYFWSIGLSARNYLTISDLINSSIFHIPISLVGVMIAVVIATTRQAHLYQDSDPIRIRGGMFGDLTDKIFFFSTFVAFGVFVLYSGPIIPLIFAGIIGLLFIAQPYIFHLGYKWRIHPLHSQMMFTFFLFACLTFLTAVFDSKTAVVGGKDNLPKVTTSISSMTSENLYQIRSLSLGSLAINDQNEAKLIKWSDVSYLTQNTQTLSWNGFLASD